jgi:hypothetical protein
MDAYLRAICGYLSIKFHYPVSYFNDRTGKLIIFSEDGNLFKDGLERTKIGRAYKGHRDWVIASRADSFLIYAYGGAEKMKTEFEARLASVEGNAQ